MPPVFVPEFWSTALLTSLMTNLVFGSATCVNRDYEGEIGQAGDTVRISSVGDVEITDYVKNAALGTPDTIDSAQLLLLIDQAKKFNFRVDDVEKFQANVNFVAEVQRRAGHGLQKVADAFIAGRMAADTDADNILPDTTVTGASGHLLYELLVDLGTALDEKDVPEAGRWAVLSPDAYGVILKDDRFVSFGTDKNAATRDNGRVGEAAGFTILRSNQVVRDASGKPIIQAGHPMATSYAEQIVKTETLRSEAYMADIVRGLHVYGAKVVRPHCLAKVKVTI